jgi:hypothetical protein
MMPSRSEANWILLVNVQLSGRQLVSVGADDKGDQPDIIFVACRASAEMSRDSGIPVSGVMCGEFCVDVPVEELEDDAASCVPSLGRQQPVDDLTILHRLLLDLI